MTTPDMQRFDDAYRTHTAPWVIGEPQPAIVALERTGLIRGAVLEPGCGLGEHTILLAALHYDVLGIDFAPSAVAQARANAAARGVDARFEVADATALDGDPSYDTVLDSALFHLFGDADRARYVDALRRVLRSGGLVHVLALSDGGRGFGPQVGESTIREAFGAGWRVEALDVTTYRGVVTDVHAEALGLAVGTAVDEPAWLARVRRV